MRNKNRIKQILLLAAFLPFLAFSVVLASNGADDSVEEEENHSVLENKLKYERDAQERAMKAEAKLKEERLKVQLKNASDPDAEFLRKQRDQVKEEFKTQRDESRSAFKESRRAVRALAIKSVMEMQIARATKALDRLSLILDKIEAKSKEMPSGVNMTQANALITKAKAQETALKAALDKAQNDFATLSASGVEGTSDDEASTVKPVQDAKNAVKSFMLTMKDIKMKLIEFHKTQQEAVKSMRLAVKSLSSDDGNDDDSTTASPSPVSTPNSATQ